MKKYLRKQLGRKIKNQRLALDLTQEELAEKLYCSRGFLSELETGAKMMSLDTLVTLERTLGIELV